MNGREPVDLAGRRQDLAVALASGSSIPAGRLFGLPELTDDDVWVDIAGASALVGVRPKTITAWLARRGPKRLPFPRPCRLLYRLYWPRNEIAMWLEHRDLQPKA